jgi:hypothetical protein
VVNRINGIDEPEISSEIATNWDAPAKTRRDIRVRLKRERPAFLAKSPYAIAKEATPKNNGTIAFKPSRNSIGNFGFFTEYTSKDSKNKNHSHQI